MVPPRAVRQNPGKGESSSECHHPERYETLSYMAGRLSGSRLCGGSHLSGVAKVMLSPWKCLPIPAPMLLANICQRCVHFHNIWRARNLHAQAFKSTARAQRVKVHRSSLYRAVPDSARARARPGGRGRSPVPGRRALSRARVLIRECNQ